MNTSEFTSKVIAAATDFGMVKDDGGHKAKNVVIRNSTGKDDNSPYFGFVNPNEQPSGAYSGISLVFFPSPNGEKYVMCIIVGTEGYGDDAEIATQQGTRRRFSRLLPSENRYAPFCKVDFMNIEKSPSLSNRITNSQINIKKDYAVKMLVGCLVDPEVDWNLINAWIAEYASFRGWNTNQSQRKAVNEALSKILSQKSIVDDKTNVTELLDNQSTRFVVLQGAPGSGKTYLAEQIGQECFDKVFMTQFHAETSFSDFVEGIRPVLNSATVQYASHRGVLLKAMDYAKDNPAKKVLLIIDEINRANLANVLGPVFYLFEPNTSHRSGDGITVNGKNYNSLPENLCVIATMNTADRSIAVVDFALRRRFAWYTVNPHLFGKTIKEAEIFFHNIESIFIKYANDDEMNLLPGGSYFTAKTRAEFATTVEYGLMPLIREYLDQGLLTSARDELFDLFYSDYNLYLYK